MGGLMLALAGFYLCFWRPRRRQEEEKEAAASSGDNAGFIPFGQSQEGYELVQEQDAGNVVPPPEYDPH